MNPLLKHPILQHMPYTDLKNPTAEGIQKFVGKRRKNLMILSVVFLVLAPLDLLLVEGRDLDLLDLANPALLVILSVAMFNLSRRSVMTQTETEAVLIDFQKSLE